MRKTIFLAAAALLFIRCGDDKTTDGGGQEIEITVTVSPTRAVLDLNTTQQFTAFVFGTNNEDVSWQVEDIAGGNAEFGTIDESGLYEAPGAEPDLDSVRASAVSVEDPSKSGTAWVILVDPTRLYVSTSGSDAEGTGSRNNPYRTIIYALSLAVMGQTIVVGPGEYDTAGGETFPIQVGPGMIVQGAGKDSTHVIGSGGSHDESGAVFSLDGNITIRIRRLHILTANSDGVGIWMNPGLRADLVDNLIGPNYIGVAVNGDSLNRPVIDGNEIIGNSIGIATMNSCEPFIRSNQITDCGIYGLHILESSRPDLGTNDSTDVGGNTIRDCDQYLIYNDSPDTIWAVGNTWQFDPPGANDDLIYDDEESQGASGPVILENQ